MDREETVREVVRYLPTQHREALRSAAKAGGMSIGAALAFSQAGAEIKKYCPPEERAKVAGLLMRTFMDVETPR